MLMGLKELLFLLIPMCWSFPDLVLVNEVLIAISILGTVGIYIYVYNGIYRFTLI